MKTTITIPDELWDEIKAQTKTPEKFLADVIVRLRALLDPAQRAIVLTADERRALEAALSLGQLASGAQLVAKVEALARLKIGDHTIPLTAAQHEELRRKAEANGLTYEEYAQRVLRQIADSFGFAL